MPPFSPDAPRDLTKKAVLCLGMAVQDFIFSVEDFPRAAHKYLARDFRSCGGGCAATAAVAIARLGGSVELASCVGGDAIGDMIIKELQDYGVDCRFAQRVAACTSPLSAVFIDARGERMIVNARDPNLPRMPDFSAAVRASPARVVLADNRFPQAAALALRTAKAQGCLTVLDADGPLTQETQEALAHASHVAFSAQALAELYPGQTTTQALCDCARQTRNFICVTDGSRGVSYAWLDAEEELLSGVVAAFPVDAVDSLGAGDVWHGAFALALAEGYKEERAMLFANAAAALKCTRFGGRAGAPLRGEVEALLASSSAL